jgi:hypothetical protein
VLEEMGEAGPADLFVLGADVIPGVDGNDGSFVVLANDKGEAISENEFLVRDIGDKDIGTFGCGFSRLRFRLRSYV